MGIHGRQPQRLHYVRKGESIPKRSSDGTGSVTVSAPADGLLYWDGEHNHFLAAEDLAGVNLFHMPRRKTGHG